MIPPSSCYLTWLPSHAINLEVYPFLPIDIQDSMVCILLNKKLIIYLIAGNTKCNFAVTVYPCDVTCIGEGKMLWP